MNNNACVLGTEAVTSFYHNATNLQVLRFTRVVRLYQHILLLYLYIKIVIFQFQK